jgi:hypothetical protein
MTALAFWRRLLYALHTKDSAVQFWVTQRNRVVPSCIIILKNPKHISHFRLVKSAVTLLEPYNSSCQRYVASSGMVVVVCRWGEILDLGLWRRPQCDNRCGAILSYLIHSLVMLTPLYGLLSMWKVSFFLAISYRTQELISSESEVACEKARYFCRPG